MADDSSMSTVIVNKTMKRRGTTTGEVIIAKRLRKIDLAAEKEKLHE